MIAARKKMLERVRAILAKTMANGCTEGEAMAALAKAQELMAAYDISEAELGNTQETEQAIVHKSASADPYGIKKWLAVAVAKFTRCRGWKGNTYAVGFAGLESDVIFANWLLDTLQAFVMRELRAHQDARRAQGLHNPRIIGASFVKGCCWRISARLIALADSATPPATATGTALVASRKAVIAQAMRDAGIHLTKSKPRAFSVNQGAYAAGTAAGDAARFDRPVSGAAGMLRIA